MNVIWNGRRPRNTQEMEQRLVAAFRKGMQERNIPEHLQKEEFRQFVKDFELTTVNDTGEEYEL